MHRIYYEVTRIQGHILLSNGIPMSLAQAWICSRKEDAMLKPQGWQSQSMARLSIGMSYYQDGYDINWHGQKGS